MGACLNGVGRSRFRFNKRGAVMRTTLAVVAFLVALLAPFSLQADLTGNTETTQDGGTFTVDPAGILFIDRVVDDSTTLTLTNSAVTSGVQALLVGVNNSGSLVIGAGSV